MGGLWWEATGESPLVGGPWCGASGVGPLVWGLWWEASGGRLSNGMPLIGGLYLGFLKGGL